MPLGTCDAGFFRGGRIHVRRCRRDCAVRAPHKAFRDAMAVMQSVVCPALLRRWAPYSTARLCPVRVRAMRQPKVDTLDPVRCLQHWAGPRTKFT
jgi:hypothetical protein